MTDWKDRALDARKRELADESDLIAGTFRLRLHNLIGVEVKREDIEVAAPQARATIDGVTFLLDGVDFYLESACPNCLETVTSEPLLTAADVGRALAEWLPSAARECPHTGVERASPGDRLESALRDLIMEYM